MKLARTRGKVGGRSNVDLGLSCLFCIGSGFVDGVARGAFSALKDPEGFPLHNFKNAERLMYNKTNIIARMRHHCIVLSISPKMP